MNDYCEFENCWECVTKELSDNRDYLIGRFCDEHAQRTVETFPYRLRVSLVKKPEEIAS